jgi:hypothetical protein
MRLRTQTLTAFMLKIPDKKCTITPWAILVILLYPLLGCQSSRLMTKSIPITVELRKVEGDQIQWTLKNQSDHYVVYENRITPGGLPSDRFDVTTLEGSPIRYKGLMVDSWTRARGFFTIVAPMSQFSTDVNLAESYELPSEIAFKVRCRTFLDFGLYKSEADAESAIRRILAKPDGSLPYFKELDTPWIVIDRRSEGKK